MSDDFFGEDKRITVEREQADHWDWVWLLMENARNYRDKARNWIQEEIKRQKYYAEFISSWTDGATKDQVVQALKRINEIDMNLLKQAVEGLQRFIGGIENRNFPDSTLAQSLYKQAIGPIEDIIQELLISRAFLQGMVNAYGDSHGSSA